MERKGISHVLLNGKRCLKQIRGEREVTGVTRNGEGRLGFQIRKELILVLFCHEAKTIGV